MADETKQSPSTNKALVFLRRSASTLGLWGLVAGIFLSRSAWAYLALMAVLVVVATVEYFRMARAAGVACFPKFGTGCAVAYCVMLHVALATGHELVIGGVTYRVREVRAMGDGSECRATLMRLT